MYSILKYFIATILVASTAFVSSAQHHDPEWSAKRVLLDKRCLENDSLKNILHNTGVFEGHIRNFFMSTVNHGDYPDYYAFAMGGGLGILFASNKRFSGRHVGFYNL